MNNSNQYSAKKKSGLKYVIIWVIALALIFVFVFLALINSGSKSYKWTTNELNTALLDDTYSQSSNKYSFSRDNVKEIDFNRGNILSTVVVNYTSVEDGKTAIKATVQVSSQAELANVEQILNNFDDYYKALNNTTKSVVSIDDTTSKFTFVDFLIYVLPTILIVVVGIFLYRSLSRAGGGTQQAFDFGKSKARLEDSSKIRFTDVAGCEDEKAEMQELVDYLKNPRKYSKAGARIPKGVILKGRPGTGKTLLAKAVAGEASVPFYYISGSDFLEMYVGVGASRVRDMFKKARNTAPCIIFIDEIDAIGRQRGTGLGGGHDEREQTLNQLLVEMDGFDGTSGVIVIAATNRSDILDPALLRPGRFDRQIEVALPDLRGRKAILEVHARNKQLAKEVSLDSIARRTPGFSGAELENVLNEAAILSVRNRHSVITPGDIDEAIDRVMSGPAKKTKVISDNSKKITAYHEAGHAVIGLKLAGAEIVQKITIIPRGDAYGYVMMTPKDESMNQTKKELEAKIVSYLGGRASEEIFFDDVTTGAYDDIKRATAIARAMVTELGMSELGPVHYEDNENQVFLGRDYGSNKSIGNDLADLIDNQIRNIIYECLSKAKEVINENKDLLILIAEALLKYETITADEIDFLVKYGSLDAYDVYKKNQEQASNAIEEAAKEKPQETASEDTKDE